jgi:cell shape-determining protein MreD
MKIIPYILYLLLLACYNTVLSEIISIYGVAVNLAVLMVALVALNKSEPVALWFAIAAGIVAGSVRLDLMPWQVMILGLAAITVNHIGRRVNLDAILSRLLILAGVILIHTLIFAILVTPDNIPYLIYRIVLPSTLYTLIIGWLFFLIKDGHLTWAKIKALF